MLNHTTVRNQQNRIAQQSQLNWRKPTLIILLCLSVTVATLGNIVGVYAQSSPPVNTNAPTNLRAIVGAHSAVLLATPGGAALRTLPPGTVVMIWQRTIDSHWVHGQTDQGEVGWLQTEYLILFGVEELPIVLDAPIAVEQLNATTTLSSTATRALTVEGAPAVTATVAAMPTSPAATQEATIATESRVTATVTLSEGRLNVRAGPGVDYEIMAKLTNGQRFTVLARTGNKEWLQLALPGNENGWVATRYVTLHGSLDGAPIYTLTAAAGAAEMAPATATQASAGEKEGLPAAIQPTSESRGSDLQGTLVFQASQGGAIYVYNLASGELRLLTSGSDPAISPDGAQIAFTRDGADGGLYLINLDGSNERKIYAEGNSLRSPKWSPNGDWLVFSRSLGSWTCYQLGRECVTRQQLVSQLPPSIANDPAAVASFLAGFDAVENPNYGIARVNVNGGEYRDLPALDTARTPDWGANGIVYQSTAGIQKTADQPDAQNQVVLAGHYLQDPDWQPAGDHILYQSRQGSHWEIFRISNDGSNAVALTHPTTTLVKQLPSNGSPAWSSNGQHIVFLSNRTANQEAGAWRIWVMDADGSNQRPLPIDMAIDYTLNGEQMVSWGP
jgi:Tol biopolymer transport system component/uncharacterized protein YraI